MAVIESLDERDKSPIIGGSIDEWGALLNSLYGLTEDKINEIIENLNSLLSISSIFQVKAYPTKSDFPTIGVVNIIYYAIDTGVRYMWDGLYISLSTGDSSVSSVNGEVGDVVLDKSDIGLGNVDNTSDITKATTINYGALSTDDKTLTGAVNELKSSKSNIESPTFNGTVTVDTLEVTTEITSNSNSVDIFDGVDSINIGDSTSNVNIKGNFIVDGTTTTVNSTVVTIKDPIVTLGEGTTVDDNKDRGIEFKWNNGTVNKVGFFGFDDSTGKFTFIPDATNSSEVFTGVAGTIVATLFEGNASTASKLETARDISLSGDVSGSVSFDGSGNVDISSTVADNSHSHTSENISDATNSNTANMIVKRDSSGDFSANQITADLVGNSDTATKLETSRTIGTLTGDITSTGSSFDGSANNTNSTTISNNVVDNNKMAQMGAYTIKANNTNSTSNAQDVSVVDMQTMLDIKNIAIKYALVMG